MVAKKGQGKWTGAECRDRVELGVCCLCCLGVCLYVWGVRGLGTKETITVRPGEGSSSRRRFAKRLVLFCYSYTIV